MCGIAGFFRTVHSGDDKSTLARMAEVILHRGPDAGGEYLDDFVGLVHRRLSIIDLSPQGNQPMTSADGRLVIVFNGEIYNYVSLRDALQRSGVVFRTKTDTEVILALYQQCGTACLNQLNGMFAFAIWDTYEKNLFLARDRIGKKPLYYYQAGGDKLAFASELKSLLQLPGINPQIEPTAIPDFLCYHYIPDPKTIYRNIYKLPPAHFMVVQAGGEPQVSEYWDVNFSPRAACSFADAEEELLSLLQDATSIRMLADVPLGAFLSGGVDSSAVVALMAKASEQPVKTCTIGFQDKRYDESVFAREIAELFKTNHTEFITKERFVDIVALLPRFFDEPFADSSAVPTYYVSHLARKAVTVALAGDGGDENFAGYAKYSVELKEDLARQFVPKPVLSLIHSAMQRCSDITLARKAKSLAGSALKEQGRAFFTTNSCIDESLLQPLLSETIKQSSNGYDPACHTLGYWNKMANRGHVSAMLYTDLKTYLPGDILVKVDRMSMANSLEVRAPFLDYRIIEFAAALPEKWKINGNSTKIILKSAFSKLLPPATLKRKKHGFTVPLDQWFRDELKPLAESSLLAQSALGELLSIKEVTRIWEEHQRQKFNHGSTLWSLLMLALWQKEYQN